MGTWHAAGSGYSLSKCSYRWKRWCCGEQGGVTTGAADKHFTSLQQIDSKPLGS